MIDWLRRAADDACWLVGGTRRGLFMQRVRALVVEDDLRLRQVLPEILETQRLDVTLAATGREAMSWLVMSRFDLTLVDLGLPDLDGVDLIRWIVETRPELPVLVLTAAQTEERIVAALQAGAEGFLFKEDIGSKLGAAIDEILAGGVPLSAIAGQVLLARLRASSSPQIPVDNDSVALTERERMVLEWLGEGYSYDEVAKCLGISVNTVRTHVRHVYDKLGVSTKTQAVRQALRLGLL